MQGIEFEEEKTYQGLRTREPLEVIENKGFIMKLLGKVGIEDRSIANFILLGVAAILFGVAIFLFAGALGGTEFPADSLRPR